MPEMLTKYPQSALKILTDAGAQCGQDIKPDILTTCPKENFCQLPTGEICVYDIKHLTAMTQLSSADFADVVSPIPTIYSSWNIILLIVACLFGMLFMALLQRK